MQHYEIRPYTVHYKVQYTYSALLFIVAYRYSLTFASRISENPKLCDLISKNKEKKVLIPRVSQILNGITCYCPRVPVGYRPITADHRWAQVR